MYTTICAVCFPIVHGIGLWAYNSLCMHSMKLCNATEESLESFLSIFCKDEAKLKLLHGMQDCEGVIFFPKLGDLAINDTHNSDAVVIELFARGCAHTFACMGTV